MQSSATLLSSATAAYPYCATHSVAGSSVTVKSASPSSVLSASLSSIAPWQRSSPLLRTRAQPGDQDYVSYEGDKSVFPAEACEELGGEACDIEGVGPEVKASSSSSKQPDAAVSRPDREYVDYKESKT
ncbi:hypothetical protein KP509_17G033800 [Ceratopteris richardii]|uniref:Uncharacterized protein n=1 Tax=Ceratopteris richardii TaxID=49495 RepID=A0A8T2STE4_CERRI|nr:hypothetical protein KP509_17G033800 [Ceratopteris richardii]